MPAPVSVTDFYLAELVGEIRGLRADLQSATSPAGAPQPPAGDGAMPPESAEVELTEPKPSKAMSRTRKRA